MKALRFALNVAGFVLAPAFIAGAVVFAALDRLVSRDHDQRLAGVADEAASWLAATGPRSLP